MDLSFTKSEDWIAKREAYWVDFSADYLPDTSRKELKAIHKYFMTGEFPSDKQLLSPSQMIGFFPVCSADGISYVLKNYFILDLHGEFTDRDFRYIQNFFMDYIELMPWFDIEVRVELFRIIFGDYYDKNRKFPFLIGCEEEYRAITLSAEEQFVNGTECLLSRLGGRTDQYGYMWLRVADYWYSLFSGIDEDLLSLRGTAKIKFGGYSASEIRDFLGSIMKLSLEYKYEWFPFGDEHRGRIDFLVDFRKRIESAGVINHEAMQIWEREKEKRKKKILSIINIDYPELLYDKIFNFFGSVAMLHLDEAVAAYGNLLGQPCENISDLISRRIHGIYDINFLEVDNILFIKISSGIDGEIYVDGWCQLLSAIDGVHVKKDVYRYENC